MSKWDSKLHLKTGIDLAFMMRYAQLFVNYFSVHGEQKIGRDGKVRYRNNLPGSIDIFRIRQSLYAERTFAYFGCDRQGKSKWTMFDLDIPRTMRKEIEETNDADLQEKLQKHAWRMIYLMTDCIMAEIKHLGLTPISISSGGKGVHIYVLCNKPIDTEQAVKLGLLVKWLAHQTQESNDLQGIVDYMEIESYPCSSDLRALKSGGLPHLVKLPLVKHLGSGSYSRFLDPDNPRIEQPLSNTHLWNLKPDSHEIVSDALESFAGELQEAMAHSRLYQVEAEPTNNPTAETYLRKNIAEGPKKVIERCAAMGELIKKAMKQRHLNHEERLFILFNMIAFGGDGVAAVHDIIKQLSDYDFSKTQYFIDHAKARNYKSYLCETAQEKGLCPLSEACDAVGRYRTPLGVVMGFDADNRAKIQPVLGDLKPAFESGTIEEIRKELFEMLNRYLRETPEKALLIQTDPGVGKTVTIAKALADLPDDLKHYKKIFWAGQRHDMFEEVAKYIPDIKQILPKIGEDEDFPNSSPAKRGLCSVEENRYKLKMMREKGWPELETQKVCLDCHIGVKNCDYFKQWNHSGSFFAPHQHLVTRKIQENTINVDLLVIDESPFNVFDVETVITRDDIDALKDFITANKFTQYKLIIPLLESLRRTIGECKKLTEGHELIQKWDDRFWQYHEAQPNQLDIEGKPPKRLLEAGIHHRINQINQSKFWLKWEAFIEMAAPEDLPKNWLPLLFKIIDYEKFLFGLEYNSRMLVKKQGNQFVLALIDSKKFSLADDTPVIFLDASANIFFYQRLVDRELVHIIRRIRMRNPVIQLIDGEYPKQSLVIQYKNSKKQSTSDKIVRLVKAVINRGECTLVISTKEFIEKRLRKALKTARLKGGYEIGHYWGLRGSNDYTHCDQVVLVGTAMPNLEELHIREQCRRLREDYVSGVTTHSYRRYGETRLQGKTRVFEDERMNQILSQHREEEMIQMIHRIRPLLYPEKKIWILSSTPLPLAADIQHVNSDEISIMLGLKLNSKSHATGLNNTCSRLAMAVSELRHNKCSKFTCQKLADKAGVNRRTVIRYAKRLCEDIPNLVMTKDGFELFSESEK